MAGVTLLRSGRPVLIRVVTIGTASMTGAVPLPVLAPESMAILNIGSLLWEQLQGVNDSEKDMDRGIRWSR